MRQTSERTWISAGSATLLLAALILYLATLDNGLQPYELRGGDLITHQYAQVEARPGNAPGYPLYTMGGWLWFHSGRAILNAMGFDAPNPIPVLSSYSTLWALIALLLLYRLVVDTALPANDPTTRVLIAWLLTAFFAVTYFFWYYATTTEQYSSAVAHTLAIFYAYRRWRAAPANDAAGFSLWLLAFLCGLTLAHMLTVALIVPPTVATVLSRAPRLLRSVRAIAGSIIAAALPLVSYVYVYVRGASRPDWWETAGASTHDEWFWSFVSTAQGREELLWGFEPGRAFFGNGFPQLIWHELSLPILLLGLVGIRFLRRDEAAILGSALVLYALFCWAYRYGNWFQVILPAYPLLLLAVAAALFRVDAHFSRAESPRGLRRFSRYALFLLLSLALIWRTSASLPAADSRNRPEDTGLARAWLLLTDPPPPGTGLFAAVDDALALQYLTRVWGISPGLTVLGTNDSADYLEHGRLVAATPDALPTLLDELPEQPRPMIRSIGPEWLLLAYDSAPPDRIREALGHPDIETAIDAAPGVRLVGYEAERAFAQDDRRAPALLLLLYWQLENDWPDGVSISVRPLRGGQFIPAPAPAGIVQEGIVQIDRPRPAYGYFTRGDVTEDMTDDAPIADGYRIELPPETLAEVDAMLLLLYRATADGFENLAEITLALPD